MAESNEQARQALYFKMNSALAGIDSARLQQLLAAGEAQAGWGATQTVEINGVNLFVKRIPLTEPELANPFSTRNLYDLPLFYNYGVGSAGFGAFRELLCLIKTTNWVLAGACPSFPMLYHHRILSADREPAALDPERHARYLAYWDNNSNNDCFLRDRAAATYELVLFLEHFPFTLVEWLHNNQNRIPDIIAEITATLGFLQRHGMLHLDADFFNILTDGHHFYLSDFGLALDQQAELAAAEVAFWGRHHAYDYGAFLANVGAHLYWQFLKLDEAPRQAVARVCDFELTARFEVINAGLLDNLDQLAEAGLMAFDPAYRQAISQYRPIIDLMLDFYRTLRANPRKDDVFPQASVQRLLGQQGIIIAT